MNESLIVEHLLDRVLEEDIEAELLAGDSGFESHRVFDVLESRKRGNLIAWRRMSGTENPSNVLPSGTA